MKTELERAATALQNAESLLFCAGAGMGVDSGLPDFRGSEGFWRAYPPFAKLGLKFEQVANPKWFFDDPALAWGFYGHRLNLYRATEPHAGFQVLKRWSDQKPVGVYTSNVDGHFQRSGIGDVREVHGSILHLQCTIPCCDEIWSVQSLEIVIDETSFRAEGELPRCPRCQNLARPNILMFYDSRWVEARSLAQEKALGAALGEQNPAKLVILEFGAGKAIPTVRRFSELLQARGATLIRINPRESDGPEGTISLEMGAQAALESLAAAL